MTIRMPVSSFNAGVFSAESEINMPAAMLRDEIFTHVQPLRAHAFLLVGDRAMSDDLAEETLRTAWRDFASFPRGGNLRTWLFTILGTVLSSSLRSATSGSEKAEEMVSNDLTARPDTGVKHLDGFHRAFAALPVIQREAMLLIVAGKFSQLDAAKICGCSGEAIMDRTDLGRQAMARILASQPHLSLEPGTDAGSDTSG